MSYTRELVIYGSSMASTLSIYLPLISDDESEIYCLWVANEDGSQPSYGMGLLANEQQRWSSYSSLKIRVFIPGELVFRTCKELPTRSRKTAAQAIPFLLEQEVAANIEEAHIAFDFLDAKSSDVTISTIEKTSLDQLIEILKTVDIDPDQIYPDTALIEPDEVLGVEDRVLFSSGEELPVVLPIDVFETIRSHTKDQADTLKTLVDDASELSSESDDSTLLHYVNFLSRDIDQVNLRQGEYLKKKNTRKSLEIGLHLAYGLVISLVFVISYWLIIGSQFSKEAENLQAQAERQYRALFPSEKRIFNIRKQMTGHLQNSRSRNQGNNFIEMFNFAVGKLNFDNETVLRQLRYQQESQSLQIEIQAKTLEKVNELNKLLSEGEQFTSELISANSNKDGIVARIRVNNS